MQRFGFIFLFTAIFINSVTDVSAQTVISKEDAYKMVKRDILALGENGVENDENAIVYGAKMMYRKNQTIMAGTKKIVTPFKSAWFFYIDDKPIYGWPHECRYIFVDVYTGEYKIITGERPPQLSPSELERLTPKQTVQQEN